MNLADAVRKASQDAIPAEIVSATSRIHEPERQARYSSDAHAEPALATPGSPLVRLEVFLPPDQINRFFQYVASTQRGVMTLREAATYLRITASKLESLASDNTIPGFQVDGKWRFSRVRIEEWLAGQQIPKERAS